MFYRRSSLTEVDNSALKCVNYIQAFIFPFGFPNIKRAVSWNISKYGSDMEVINLAQCSQNRKIFRYLL